MKLKLTGEMEMDLSAFVTQANEWIDACGIDAENLTHQMCEQPGMFAYYGAIAAYAKKKLAKAKIELKKLESEVFREVQNRYKKQGEKVALRVIEMEVDEDDRVQGMRDAVLDIKLESDLCGVASASFTERSKMLISVGAQERSEIGNLNPMVRQMEERSESKLKELTSQSRKLSEIHMEKMKLREQGKKGGEDPQTETEEYHQTQLLPVGKPRR
jgi:hypothetical protein